MADSSNGSAAPFIKMPTIKYTKLFINGEFVDSVSGRTFDTIDPSTEEVITRVAEGDQEDVDLAVKAARHAFDHGPWPRLSGSQRGRIIMKFAVLIEENAEELAALETIDAGKVFGLCKTRDIPFAATNLRYNAGAADKIHGEVLTMSRELQGYTLREPIGVVGHIIPWNFPTIVFFNKVSPALTAGCTMVVKPAEQTPLSALFYAHLAKLVGIPDGVINVIIGFGPTADAAITSHMEIDQVSFTGSTKVGRLVMQAATTSNLKQVSLELGGKSPLLIFQDADLDVATDLALFGIFYNKEDMLIAKDEIFGPVMALMKFKTVEEAIERANNTRYGLAAGIITKNLNLANTVSRSIRAGIIWINCYLAF